MAENDKLEQTAQSSERKTDKAGKAKKSGKDAKPGIFARAAKWLREMKSELKKVQWPTRKQVINNTLIVIACVVVVGVFIWLFDFIAGEAVQLLIGLRG